MPYWYIGSKKYYNKRDFLVDVQISTENYGFYISDEFDQHNWSTPIKTEWKELLKNRCEELRSKNKYLRLWYTGGADSQTILNAFLDNNILLDEIVVAFHWDKHHKEHNNLEQILVVKPFLKKKFEDLKNTKITNYELNNENVIPYLNDKENGWSKSSYTNMPYLHLTPTLVKDYWTGDDEKEILNIIGDAKYNVGIDNTGFYTHVIDNNVIGAFDSPNFQYDFFYLSPSIWKKQSQIVIDHAKNTGILDFIQISDPKGKNTRHSVYRNGDRLNRDPLPYEFSFGKSPDTCPFDWWKHANITKNGFLSVLKNIGFDDLQSSVLLETFETKNISVIHRLYNEGNMEVLSAYVSVINYNEKYYNNIKNKNLWLKNPKTVVAGFTGTLTKKYYLETFDKNALSFYKNIFNVDTFE